MESICIIDRQLNDAALLTIAIPTYKRNYLLKETLRSVFNLKFNIPIEIIIVDNDPGNTDSAIEEMQEFAKNNFKYYINKENYGLTGNWNRCLELGTGKLITILHDDDLLCGNFPIQLDKYLNSFHDTDTIPMVGFGSCFFEQRDKTNKVEINLFYKISRDIYNKYKNLTSFKEKKIIVDLQDYIFNAYYVATLGVVMDRKKALSINGFDNYWYPIIDYEFYIRWIRLYGNVVYINTKVSKYRILENCSMQADIITGVLDKNYELRMKIFNEEHHLIGVDKFAKIMREIEKSTWSLNWKKNDDFKMSTLDTLKLLLLKFKCLCHIRKSNLKKKIQSFFTM